MRAICYFCHQKTIKKLVDKFNPDDETAGEFLFAVHEFMANNWKISNPNLARELHYIAKKVLKIEDLYANEKKMANKLLLEQYPYWQKKVNNHPHPFRLAAKLAVTGNIIDYGAHSVNDDINKLIHDLLQQPFKTDDLEELQARIKNAKKVIYLGDNAGEIVFDKLFIETMSHPNVTYAVRGEAVINDVTREDVYHTGMDKVCHFIDNGHDAPSTILDKSSNEFTKAYKDADVVISKGQGNFEGLMNESKPGLFFLLIAKCQPMADLLGVSKGNLIVRSSNRVQYAV